MTIRNSTALDPRDPAYAWGDPDSPCYGCVGQQHCSGCPVMWRMGQRERMERAGRILTAIFEGPDYVLDILLHPEEYEMEPVTI